MSCFNNENGATEKATVLGCSGEIDLVYGVVPLGTYLSTVDLPAPDFHEGDPD